VRLRHCSLPHPTVDVDTVGADRSKRDSLSLEEATVSDMWALTAMRTYSNRWGESVRWGSGWRRGTRHEQGGGILSGAPTTDKGTPHTQYTAEHHARHHR